jgi:TolA-binding protein
MFSPLAGYKDASAMKDESDYRYARGLLDAGDRGPEKIEQAREILSGLGNLDGAQEALLDCDYYDAHALLESGDYSAAWSAFKALGGHRDSADMLSECQYRKGRALFSEDDYAGAAERFLALGGYKDAPAMLLECYYLDAHEKLEAKQYGEAYNLFSKAKGYEDSDTMLLECRYRYGKDLFASGDYIGAEERFEAIGDYKDSAALLLETRYLYGKSLYDKKDYAAAEKVFAQTAGYKDSDTLKSECKAKTSGSKKTITTADGKSLAVGSRVYARASGSWWGQSDWYRGVIVSIDGSEKVTVKWNTYLKNNGSEFKESSISKQEVCAAKKLYSAIPKGG